MSKTRSTGRRILLTATLFTLTPIVAGASYLGATQIRDYTKRYSIRSIVNLRGPSPKAQWYSDEIAEAKTLGLTHVDFRMRATRETSFDRVDELEKILRDVPKPVLIHCQAGSIQ